MHSQGQTLQFHWPSRDDVCYVPTDKLLRKIYFPITPTGRLYTIDKVDYSSIVSSFQNM